MASLTNQQIDQTYDGLLKLVDNDAATGTLKDVTDGLGNVVPLQISTTDINFTGNVTGITNIGGIIDIGNVSDFVVADSNAQGIFFDAGTNMTIGYDNATKVITFDAAGGSAGLVDDLNDSIYSDLTAQPAQVTGGGTNAISIGRDAQVNGGNGGIAIGWNTRGGEGTVVIGQNAFLGDIYGTAIGQNSRGGYFGAALGAAAYNNSNFSVAVGGDSRTETDYGIAIGYNAQSRAENNISIGQNSLVDDAVRINTVVIGSSTGSPTKAAQYSTAVGSESLAVGSASMALGYRANCSADGATALGSNVSATTPDTVTLKRLQMLDYASLNFPDDGTAAANGIPLGGVYHNNGALLIRII